LTVLGLDAAVGRAGIAVLAEDGEVAARVFAPARPGLIETLPLLLQQAATGRKITLMAVTIGPGSFTGLRTVISLAQGFAAAASIPLVGVTVAEAYAAAFPGLQRPLWVAIRARKGRIFLIRDGVAEAFADEDIPRVRGKVALAGDAANEVAATLAAAGADVLLTNARLIDPVWVAQAAVARGLLGLAPHPVLPLYVDPPEAKLPAAGLRPPPA